LAQAPGFIRRFSFSDGPHGTLIALWRTAADARAFFASDQHQAVMRELYRQRWAYSQSFGAPRGSSNEFDPSVAPSSRNHFAGLREMK
jgi:heme-degrading monooxygenase HmoA